jgi:hypothetical protein
MRLCPADVPQMTTRWRDCRQTAGSGDTFQDEPPIEHPIDEDIGVPPERINMDTQTPSCSGDLIPMPPCGAALSRLKNANAPIGRLTGYDRRGL